MKNLIIIIIILFIIIPLFLVFIYDNNNPDSKKNIKENFSNLKNVEYKKYSDTLVSIPKKIQKNISNDFKGNLDQCKNKLEITTQIV